MNQEEFIGTSGWLMTVVSHSMTALDAASDRPGWPFASRPGPGRDDLDPGRDRDRDRDNFKIPAGTGIR